jgi:hypothetical protein
MGLARERLERERAAFARRLAGACDPRVGGCALLDDRVLLAAGFALALPAAAEATAILANESGSATCHDG